MKRRLFTPYSLCLVAGALLGVAFGDRVFPVIEHMLGEPADEILMSLGGVFLTALLFELVTFGRNLVHPRP